MVFLFILLAIIILAVIFIISSKVKIEIQNLKLSADIPGKVYINTNYKIIVKLYVLEKLPIIKMSLTKPKIEKFKLKEKIKKSNSKILRKIEKDAEWKQKIRKVIKNLKILIREINLKVEIGTENAGVTSILVTVLSTMIAFILRKHIKDYRKQRFKVKPLYYNQNLANIEISGIFEIKMIHIINIIYILNRKKGVKKYERTSDRRTYGYSYE